MAIYMAALTRKFSTTQRKPVIACKTSSSSAFEFALILTERTARHSTRIGIFSACLAGLIGVSGISSVYGYDKTALLLREQTLLTTAKQQESVGDLHGAELTYLNARQLARQLSPDSYHVETDVLAQLANVYAKEKEFVLAEKTYKERLDILLRHQRDTDLDVGTALFDLQSFYDRTGRLEEATAMMGRAIIFYQRCKERASLSGVCDRRLAEVQGLYGAYLFEHNHPAAAEPYLMAVADRPDSGVRPEVLEAALVALDAISVKKANMDEARRFGNRAIRLRAQVPASTSRPISRLTTALTLALAELHLRRVWRFEPDRRRQRTRL